MKKLSITSVVHHHVKEGKMSLFIEWLERVKVSSNQFPGFIDSKLIEGTGSENEVISIFRFENNINLKDWLESKAHLDYLEELKLIVEDETIIKSYSGLEFWFDRNAQSTFKMSLLTYIGLLPLVLTIPLLIKNNFNITGFALDSIATAIIVLLMSYIIMPLVFNITDFISRKIS